MVEVDVAVVCACAFGISSIETVMDSIRTTAMIEEIVFFDIFTIFTAALIVF